MIDEAVRGFIAGAVGRMLLGRWMRRHPRLSAAICIPFVLVVAFMAGRQMLG